MSSKKSELEGYETRSAARRKTSKTHEGRSELEQTEADVVKMIDKLEARISELELEKRVIYSSKRQAAAADKNITMQEIRDHGASASYMCPPMQNEYGTMIEDDYNDPGKQIKSGYDVKSQFRVRREVKWPHGHLGPVQHLCPNPKPDALDIESFFYGYFMILGLDNISPTELYGRIQHGKQILHHAMLHDWKSARRFHYNVLWAMEHENLSWQDKEQMALLSMSAAQERGSHSTSSHFQHRETHATTLATNPVAPKEEKTIMCYMYNRDSTGCKFERSSEGCKKLHACIECAKKGFFNKHPAWDCKK